MALTLVTPGEGTLQLSADRDPELFRLARVGLGALGVVADVTLQCVPVHRLVEHTFVASAKVGGGKASKKEPASVHQGCIATPIAVDWVVQWDLSSFASVQV